MSAEGRPTRRLPLWAAVAIAVAVALLLVVGSFEMWIRNYAWPPFVAPGDALGIVMQREALLPRGAVWRPSRWSGAVRVFGILDESAQDRFIEAVRAECRRRGKMPGYATIAVEFWPGMPPADEHARASSSDPPGPVRTVPVP